MHTNVGNTLSCTGNKRILMIIENVTMEEGEDRLESIREISARKNKAKGGMDLL